MPDELESFFNLNRKNAVAAPATVFIYGLNDPTTGKCRYVGKAVNPHKRFGSHLLGARGSDFHKDRWIRGLAAQGLKPVLEVLDEVPALEWEFWEREYIRVFRMIGFNLTNLTDGGGGTVNLAEESRDKMRAAKIGKKRSPETCAKISASTKGKKKSPEACAARMGRVLSEETRAKIGASNSGKKRSLEARAKMREAHIGKHHSEQHRRNILLGNTKTIARRTLAGLTPYRRNRGA